MARGFDELVEFLLEEIALCGVPGTYLHFLSQQERYMAFIDHFPDING